MTERQKYSTIEKIGKLEIRRYEPCVLATVTMNSDYRSSTSGAFRYLFSYISKGNTKNESISMTAPVISASADHSENNVIWKVSFVMPAGSTLENMPSPIDSKVKMEELDFHNCAVMPFRGRATENLAAKKEKQLRELARIEGIPLTQETRICRFDPPFKPGFMQYNEIVVPVLPS